MATQRNLTVQTPGAQPAAVEAPAPEQAAPAAEAEAVALPPDLQAVVNAAIAKGVADGLARALPAAAPVAPKPAVVLPKHDDALKAMKALPIDDQRPVLTDQGWIVPEKPQHPNAPKIG